MFLVIQMAYPVAPMPAYQPAPQPAIQMAQATTVVVNQPEPVQKVGLPPATRDWSSGICGCCSDCHVCM